MFTPNHFLDLGSRSAVGNALSRLTTAGTIRRLAFGLYDYPATDPVLGTVAPSADAIACALVVRDAIQIQPSGAYAANLLGLSDQVPSRIVVLTDGPARRVKIGKREIILQPALHTRIWNAIGETGWQLDVDPDMPDGKCLLFHYPSVFTPGTAGYVRPVVKIELGARSDDCPHEVKPILPYVKEHAFRTNSA